MKAKVISKLNKRLWPSTKNTPLPNPLVPNDLLDVLEEVEGEAVIPTNNKWYKTDKGFYVWSGGVSNAITSAKEVAQYDDFINGFEGDGANVGIAVLDSGVNQNHPFLKNHVKYYESFLLQKSKSNITSHGNRVAGVLASSDPSLKRNKSNLYCLRVVEADGTVNSKSLEDAFFEIKNSLINQVDIINMSINVLYEDVEKLQPMINSLNDKGILTVVAGGENNHLNNTSLLKNVIKIASFNQAKFNVVKNSGLNALYSNSFLNVPIPSYTLNGSSLDASITQDSAYCAVVSSLLARWISTNNIEKSLVRVANANTFLKDNCVSIKTQIVPKPFTLYI